MHPSHYPMLPNSHQIRLLVNWVVMRLPTWSAVFVFLLLQPARVIDTEPSQLSTSNTYDHVHQSCNQPIDGGPCRVSRRVSYLCTGLSPNTATDWNFITVAQLGLNGHPLPYSKDVSGEDLRSPRGTRLYELE
ncbi:hypothetical protein BJV78DRAFT_692406 [Lactifluus subvellereus]|nr:hypothetical protein BJV78DRAFT_692406 [Lactifluus subvellereus]